MSATAPKTDIKERPIVLRANEVRAVLEGRKTQHRTAINPQPIVEISRREQANRTWHVEVEWKGTRRRSHGYAGLENGDKVMLESWAQDFCPYGYIGDRLWVREALRWTDYLVYDADREPVDPDHIPAGIRIGRDYLPMTHMPRWASRITLEIENVRVERLQEITVDDIVAEGIQPISGKVYSRGCGVYVEEWIDGWDAINAKRGHSWDSDPFVWVIEFKKL